MKRFSRWLWQNWFEFRKRFLGRQAPLKTSYDTDFPDKFDGDRIYLIGEDEHIWFAGFLCPCGCQTPVQLSLLSSSEPHWTFSQHWDGTISLSPSVWRKDACRSHYFVRRGFIEWVK